MSAAAAKSALHIADGLTLPLDAVTQTFAILGIRGSGKTNTGVVIVEELLHAGQQVVIIDPVDVWWGLKSSKDGKHAGYTIPVIGGEHGDVPLEGAGGIVIADFIVDTRASAVISLRHLSMNDQRRFAADFARRLYERKGAAEHRSPMMLVVDEADEFMPQRIPKGHEAMFGAFDRIVRRGRASGLGIIPITQRPQVLNKDILSQMETLVAHRVLHKLDRTALEAWIVAHDTKDKGAEFMQSLASLDRGDAWIWSPSWLDIFKRVHIRARNTFDSSATPKAGQHIAPPKTIAEVDLDKLRSALSQTIEKQKADNPVDLRKRIAELERRERQAAAAPVKAGVDSEALKKEFERGAESVKREMAREWKKFEHAASSLKSRVVTAFNFGLEQAEAIQVPTLPSLQSVIDQVKSGDQKFLRESTMGAARPPAGRAGSIPRPAPSSERVARSVSNHTGVGAGERAILTACAQHGDQGCTREQLTVLTGYKRSSRDTYLQRLTSKGLVASVGGSLLATQAGIDALGSDFNPLPTGSELAEYWLNRLGGGEQRILDLLLKAPDGLDRNTISEKTGYQRSSRDTYLQRLSARKLVDTSVPGIVRVSQELLG